MGSVHYEHFVRLVRDENSDVKAIYIDGKLKFFNKISIPQLLSELDINFKVDTILDESRQFEFEDMPETTAELDEMLNDIEDCKIDW
jgi:hypothetical protein